MDKIRSKHGMNNARGLERMTDAKSKKSTKKRYAFKAQDPGRFGRLFPLSADITPLNIDITTLKELGGVNGPMRETQAKQKFSSVPLGMVFMGQFIDHDITFDPISRLGALEDPDAVENFRTPALDLDCVYDSGPEASAHLFNRNLSNFGGEDWRGYLISGVDGTAYTHVQGPQFDDLSRNVSGTAIIADPRNDENRVISQLQLAFIRFHNQMMEAYKDEFSSFEERYEEASKITRWTYQYLIVQEFLPAMIGQELTDKILNSDNNPSSGRKIYNPSGRPFIPIEFSVAAYRFGHSMTTNNARLNGQLEDGLFSANVGRGFTAISRNNQVVDWSFFFEVDGSEPQKAARLDTKLAPTLLDLPFIPSTDERSLATRNLIRGNDFQLPAGEVIAAQIKQAAPDRFPASYESIMSDFIADTSRVGSESLLEAGKTPLWFYILAEAAVFGRRTPTGAGGETLGPVGGSIVGEVLVGLIQKDMTSYLHENPTWTPAEDANTFGKFLKRSLDDRGEARKPSAAVV